MPCCLRIDVEAALSATQYLLSSPKRTGVWYLPDEAYLLACVSEVNFATLDPKTKRLVLVDLTGNFINFSLRSWVEGPSFNL